MNGRTEAIVTFVMRGGECLAFFRARRENGETEWVVPAAERRGSRLVLPGYAHDGQHAEFDKATLSGSRRATEQEYSPLLDELNSLGYSVIPLQFGRLKLPKYRMLTDGELAELDRGGIWSLMWKMRDAGASPRALNYACKRWEQLTGKEYYGEEG
jgi:hypothetical protein